MIGILGYAVYNLTKKVEDLEDIIEEQDDEYLGLRRNVRTAIEHMRAIDSKEAFEKDDEVGSVFRELVNIIEDIEDEDAS